MDAFYIPPPKTKYPASSRATIKHLSYSSSSMLALLFHIYCQQSNWMPQNISIEAKKVLAQCDKKASVPNPGKKFCVSSGPSHVIWWSLEPAQWLLIFMYHKHVGSDLVLSSFCFRPAGNCYSLMFFMSGHLCVLTQAPFSFPCTSENFHKYKQRQIGITAVFSKPCFKQLTMWKWRGGAFQTEVTAMQRKQNQLGNVQVTEQWESPCCYSKSSYNIASCSLLMDNCPWPMVHYWCLHRAPTYLHQLIIYWLETVLSHKDTRETSILPALIYQEREEIMSEL